MKYNHDNIVSYSLLKALENDDQKINSTLNMKILRQLENVLTKLWSDTIPIRQHSFHHINISGIFPVTNIKRDKHQTHVVEPDNISQVLETFSLLLKHCTDGLQILLANRWSRKKHIVLAFHHTLNT